MDWLHIVIVVQAIFIVGLLYGMNDLAQDQIKTKNNILDLYDRLTKHHDLMLDMMRVINK